MKRQLLATAIVTILLLSIIPFFPVGATEPIGWSKPRPTGYRPFNDTLGNSTVSADGQTALTLGVNIGAYTPASGGVDDNLVFMVDVAATTREGIDYEWNPSAYGFSWVNVSQPIGISGDNTCILFNLSFPVLYYGVNYSSVWVYSNGFVSFTSANYSGASPCSLPNSSMPDAIVAPFWRKLKLSQGGSVETGHIIQSWPGDRSTAYQIFIWDNIPDENGHRQTFQLLLEDRVGSYAYNNKIYFQYLSITNDIPTTIGVQDRLGHHGQSYPLSQISNQSCGGMNTVRYGMGYRLNSLEYTVTKSDSNAKLNPLDTYEEGSNVDLNGSGNHYGKFWATVIEAGANALLDWCGVGEVVDGLFVLYDITDAAASTQYIPASGTLTSAGPGNGMASGIVYCDSQGAPMDGSYIRLPFDASFTNSIYWFFLDRDQSLSHTITVTATACYVNELNQAAQVSTSVVLNMYTGSHYLDIGSNICGHDVSKPISGLNVYVDGQQYSTPVSGLIVSQGLHNITAASTIYANGSPRYYFREWSDGRTDNSLPTEDVETDWSNYSCYGIVGDINFDGTVNILDAITMANSFNSTPGDNNWNNGAADLNHDRTVNILDAIILANNFGLSYATGSASGMSGQQSHAAPMTQGGPSVLVDPSQVTMFKGETFTVNVDVTSVTNLQGWEFKLYWNSTALSCTNASVVTPTIWQGNTQDDGPGLQANYNSTNGRFWWAEAANYPVSSFNGSMTIATLTFQALQPGTTSLTLADTTLGDSSAQPINCSVSSGSVTVYYGRYMRSDTQTINGLGAYVLNIPESNNSASFTQSGSGSGVSWGIRAWVRHSDGTEQEISLDGQTGTPAAVVYMFRGAGIQSATVSVSQTGLQQTDSLVIRVYVQVGGSSWTLCATFTTEQLQATTLQATTWTVYYYTYASYNRLYGSIGTFYWGTATYNSRIQNLQYT